jgi:nucleoside-diphosphate-sugar epimerase
MKTAAVIGANGFLGTCLLKKLISQNINTIAVFNLNNNKQFSEVNYVYKEDFLSANYDVDFIYFVSGNYLNSHKELIEINSDLQRYINKYPNVKFVYISSTNVYGYHTEKITENSSYNSPSLYARFKLAGEFLISSLNNFSIVRLTYLYGPGIKNTSFLPTIINSAKVNNEIIINGDGSRFQDYLYIEDAVDLCFNSANILGNQIFLGASGIKTTNIEVATILSNQLGSEIKFVGEENGHSFSFDPQKTFSILNWEPKVNFKTGLIKMLE